VTASIIRLIPHGQDGHYQTDACRECKAELDEIFGLMRDLLARGFARIVGKDEYGDDIYTVTPEGAEWLKSAEARRVFGVDE
jgi:hypothetical protein